MHSSYLHRAKPNRRANKTIEELKQERLEENGIQKSDIKTNSGKILRDGENKLLETRLILRIFLIKIVAFENFYLKAALCN